MNTYHIILSRLGAASIFLVFGTWEILEPMYWIGYLPSAAAQFGNPGILVMIHGAALFVVGLALLTGFKLRIAAILATLMLLSIVVSLIIQSGFGEIVMRDISILLFTASLIFIEPVVKPVHSSDVA